MTGWELPKEAVIGGKTYQMHTDYRQILEIFSYLQDVSLPEFIRWQIAVGLFYDEPVPKEDFAEAAEYFCRFVNCGCAEEKPAGPALYQSI